MRGEGRGGEGRGGGWWGGDWWDIRVRTLEIYCTCYVKLVPAILRFTESCSPETFTVFLLALNGACRSRAELYFPLL